MRISLKRQRNELLMIIYIFMIKDTKEELNHVLEMIAIENKKLETGQKVSIDGMILSIAKKATQRAETI